MPCRGALSLVLCHITFAIDYVSSQEVLCSLGKALLFKMIAPWWPDAYCPQQRKKLMSIRNDIKIIIQEIRYATLENHTTDRVSSEL